MFTTQLVSFLHTKFSRSWCELNKIWSNESEYLNSYNWNKINKLLIIMFKTIVSSIFLWLDLAAECAKLGTANRKHSLTNVVDSKLKRILDLNSKVGTMCLSFFKNKVLLCLLKMNSIHYILGRQDVKRRLKRMKNSHVIQVSEY